MSRSFSIASGRRSGSTAIILVCVSSTYSWTASSTCGAMSRVSPVYHIGSSLATTTLASLPIRRTMFDRLSKRSCPLTASTTHLFPRRTATLTRSHSISRRPSLAMV